ncbi:hypothetical protein [Heyndrickxia ginsengihumi]|uniref:hypothetical protein n=1 Tax=Heyndrickxia ginsengihumi TaxID=363870 RepID=UPI001F44F74E|nr:hypothetical protein [Heyndrickxia ginsengihumi]
MFFVNKSFNENEYVKLWIIIIGVIALIVLGLWSSIRLTARVAKMKQYVQDLESGNFANIAKIKVMMISVRFSSHFIRRLTIFESSLGN